MDEWRRPELIVLVRGKPEEAVLTACKTSGILGDPNNAFGYCYQGGVSFCAECSQISAS